MTDTVLKLSVPGQSDFIFTYFEVPEHIAIGGNQKLAVHELIGGKRVVDAMGRSDRPLQWSGRLRGQSSLARARYLDGLRISGKQATLTWSEFNYTVVVEEFTADFERFYNMPYQISCVVVQDNVQPIVTVTAASLDDSMRNDMAAANSLGAGIGDGSLSATLATLDSAIKSVSSFATSTQAMISSVLTPLAAVQSRVNLLIGTVGSTANNVASFGGILPNTSVARQAARFSSQAAASTQLPMLYNLQAVTGRMSLNLGGGK